MQRGQLLTRSLYRICLHLVAFTKEKQNKKQPTIKTSTFQDLKMTREEKNRIIIEISQIKTCLYML